MRIFGRVKKYICVGVCLALCLLFGYGALVACNRFSVVAAETNANFTNLVVFAKFSGEEEFIDDVCGNTDVSVRKLVDNGYFNAEYSVQDYFKRVSNGKVNMQTVYLYDTNGGSLTLSHTRGYYCSHDTNNEEGYTDAEYALRMSELKADWSAAISAAVADGATISDVNGETRYALSDLDKDKDGYVDCLTIVYPYSTQYSVSWSGCLWNYQSFYDGAAFVDGNDEIRSGKYVQFTANFTSVAMDKNGVAFSGLKTMIHETGHVFGLKDLYRSDNTSRVHYMSAMSHALSPVPQYISAKEREALGWFNEGNVVEMKSSGTYTIGVTSDEPAEGVVCYKLPLPNTNRTLYVEYRKFDGTQNKYDTQLKTISFANGLEYKGVNLKSGLVCFLVDSDTLFPNNLYTSGSRWNYEVLGGVNGTKNDSALREGESLMLTSTVEIVVESVAEEELTFRLIGLPEHVHDAVKTEYKAASCTAEGNIAYWYCSACNGYFSDERLTQAVDKEDTVIGKTPHDRVRVDGVAATCTTTGWTDGEKCDDCGKVFVERQEIAALPHTPSAWIVDKEATPTENGARHKECIVCAQVLESETLAYEGESEPPPKEDEPNVPPPKEDEGEELPPSDSSGGDEPPETPPSDDIPPPNDGGTQSGAGNANGDVQSCSSNFGWKSISFALLACLLFGLQKSKKRERTTP